MSRRPFVPAEAGGPIRRLSTENLKVTAKGVDVVEKHLSRFIPDGSNKVMIERLRAISKGELKATQVDMDFYAHELREYVRYRKQGFPAGGGDDSALWNNAHTATLEEYRIYEKKTPNPLYTPDASAAEPR